MAYRDVETLDQLWGDGVVRAFISHKAEDKVLATQLKEHFANNGIASFVAHEDIEPMSDWEQVIERALFSMDLLIALLTVNFSDSKWTDQEIGVAVGRKIPVIPVRKGKDPYGLIGKYQAVSGSAENGTQIGNSILEFLFRYQGDDTSLRELAKDIYIAAVRYADSFYRANHLADFLPGFERLSSTQEKSLVKAFNDNPQVYRAHDFRRIAAQELNRITGNTYVLMRNEFDQSTCWLERASAVHSEGPSF